MQVPGIKLWSDGIGEHRRWVTQYMRRTDEQLLEVQVCFDGMLQERRCIM